MSMIIKGIKVNEDASSFETTDVIDVACCSSCYYEFTNQEVLTSLRQPDFKCPGCGEKIEGVDNE